MEKYITQGSVNDIGIIIGTESKPTHRIETNGN